MKIVSKVWNKKQEISPIFFILTSAIILISLRWLIIYLFNPSEPLVNKIFFDLNDPIYFAYILNLSDLNFKPDYLINYIPDKIIALPIYSLIIHSITYAFFNEYSFIIVEYLSFFLFIYIFTKIFNELNISTYFSLILSLSIFFLPEFLVYFKHLKINLINFQILNSLYSFQIPRPVISSIYFFWGLLLAIYYHKYQNKNYLFILIGFNLALNFGSVYYNFVILSVLFFILFLNKVLKNNKFFLLYSLKNIFITLVTFFIFALPFIILLFFSEKDWLIRAGTFDPSFYQKKILISYFILKLLSVKFLLFCELLFPILSWSKVL